MTTVSGTDDGSQLQAFRDGHWRLSSHGSCDIFAENFIHKVLTQILLVSGSLHDVTEELDFVEASHDVDALIRPRSDHILGRHQV